jgi:hypothetical protein
MGDRVLFVCHDGGSEIAPAIYGHWCGYEALDMLAAAAPRMRKGDVSYAAARLCGYLHEQNKGALGLGLIAPPESIEPDTLAKFSHGDAGVVAVNVNDGSWTLHGGYLARRQSEPDEEDEPITTPNPLPLYEG